MFYGAVETFLFFSSPSPSADRISQMGTVNNGAVGAQNLACLFIMEQVKNFCGAVTLEL